MSLELYFLRSTEQKIVQNMLYYSQRLDETEKSVADDEGLKKFYEFYGLTSKDLGLYAMREHQVCGAIWARRLGADVVLNIAVKPEFRNQGIATAMMEQFLLEAGALYTNVSVSVSKEDPSIVFFKKFGFIETEENEKLTLTKEIEQKEVVRPSDGYDARKWMD